MHTDYIYYIMNLKGNNAQTYPYSAFILKREFQTNVRQAGKFLPNTKWQKKPLPLQIICQEMKVNHRKHFLIFSPTIWDIFLNQNKLIWILTVVTGKHENILLLVDFHIALLSKSTDAAQPGNTENVANVLPVFIHKEPWSDLSFILDQDNLTKTKSNEE